MAAFSSNPLFQRASREIRDAMRREFKGSQLGQLIDAANESIRSANIERYNRLGRVLKNWKDRPAHAQWHLLMGETAGEMAREIEKYSRGDDIQKQMLKLFLKSLGPVGQLLGSISKPLARAAQGKSSSATGDLAAMIRILQSHGFEVLPPAVARQNAQNKGYLKRLEKRGLKAARKYLEDRGEENVPKGKPFKKPLYRAKALPETKAEQQAKNLLEELGYELAPVPEPYGPKETVYKIAPDFRPGYDLQPEVPKRGAAGGDTYELAPAGPQQVRIPGAGFFPANHPIVTGAMVRTPESSDVYAFGYSYQRSALFIQFKADQKDQKGKHKKANRRGALYRYNHVPPTLFLKMLDASSKGAFIWDNIRVRGTVSGHRYDYTLAGVANGHVPRKATLLADGEHYIKRSVQTVKGNRLESQLPDELVRPLMSLRPPNTGAPKRPNDGRRR